MNPDARRFEKELAALGGRMFLAESEAAAREYIERVVADKGGPALAARRPAVDRLGLRGMDWKGDLAEVNVGVTQADYALADTGTLVVFAAAGEGRALSLLPPVHVAVLEASRILPGLDALLEREPDFPARSSAMIFISGPSRTADIEITLSVGVHGPGELHVVILP